ncbi:putative groEL-like equatorial domain superfamily [Helianthus anomalus]
MQASFVGAMAIADLVKTTLGPKGMASLISQLHGTCIQLPADTKIPSSAYIKTRG